VELIERESKPKEFLDLVLSITGNPDKATVPTIIGEQLVEPCTTRPLRL